MKNGQGRSEQALQRNQYHPESSNTIMSTEQITPILNIKVRNTGVAIQFIVAVILLLFPFYWTQLTGYPVDIDFSPWICIGGAIICSLIAFGAIIPKTVTLSTNGIDYIERGKPRFNLDWQDITKIENSVRSISSRPASNIHFTCRDGKVHQLDSAKINDKVLKRIYATIEQDVATQYHHIRFVDHGEWSKGIEKTL